MKSSDIVLMILPPALLVMFLGMARAFSIQFDYYLVFPIFAALWFFSSLACLVRGTWILKSGWQFFVVLAVLYLLFLATILNILFVFT